MADRGPTRDDILAFMDGEENRIWMASERSQIFKVLEELWRIIPDPTDSELRQVMRDEDWQNCQQGHNREGIRNFYIRKWKKDRKADAMADPKTFANTDWPPWYKTHPPWEYNDNPELEDLLKIMLPCERTDWDKGGHTLQQREEILSSLQKRWRGFKKRDKSSVPYQREAQESTCPDRVANKDVVRKDGYTDREVAKYFEKRFAPSALPMPQQRFTFAEVGPEIKQHRGWYFLAFLLGGLPVGIDGLANSDA